MTEPEPTEPDNDQTEPRHVTASRVGTIAIPMITAMDIDPINGDIWIMTYFQGYRFPGQQNDDSLATQLAKIPEAVRLPRWKQIEAVAVDEHHHVWLTSEGSPTPFCKLQRD